MHVPPWINRSEIGESKQETIRQLDTFDFSRNYRDQFSVITKSRKKINQRFLNQITLLYERVTVVDLIELCLESAIYFMSCLPHLIYPASDRSIAFIIVDPLQMTEFTVELVVKITITYSDAYDCRLN